MTDKTKGTQRKQQRISISMCRPMTWQF